MENNAALPLQSQQVVREDQISFYLDECVDNRIVASLRKDGVSVVTAQEMGLGGEENDSRQLAKAVELRSVLVTGDKGFGAINKKWLGMGKHHTGIIFISYARPRPPGELAKKLIEIYETKRPEEIADLFLPI
jgi:hypothetical protein